MKWFCCVVFFIGYLLLSQVTSSSLEDLDYEDDYDYGDFNSTSNGTLQFVKELMNVSRDAGKMIKMVCEVKNLDANATNSKVTFNWLKFSVPILKNDRRITIKQINKPEQRLHKSILKITNLEATDKAFYECVASNGIDKVRSQGILTVNNEKWTGFSSDLPSSKITFENMDLQSASDLTTFLPHTDQHSTDELLSTITNPVLPKLSEQTVDNPVLFEKSTQEKFQKEKALTYNPMQKFCQPYTGTRCKEFLHNSFVFVQPPYDQETIEMKLSNAFVVISQSQDISSSCNNYAVPSLCFSAFPICVNPTEINTYQTIHINKNRVLETSDKKAFRKIRSQLKLRRICKEDCKLLETELCSKEYAIAKRHPVIGQILELEECEFLPEEAGENSKECLKLGVDRSQIVDASDSCFWDDGIAYRGVTNKSASGATCLRWSHQFHIPLSEHPELVAHNYCRNPGGQESQPFCYIEQNKKELCSISKCAHILGVYIGLALSSFFIVFCAIIIIYCIRRRRHKNTRNLQNMNTPAADKNIYGNPGPNSPMELNTLLPPNIPPQRNHHHASKNSYQSLPQYTYKEVSFVEELGEGAFGKVYKGELKTKAGKVFVAVKSLKENASAKTLADFQREIELISELKHPNIICLLGVVVKQEPMCMLFEFMSEGDLHEFLIANSPNNDGRGLTQIQFLHIAIQIAQGMEYLSENHYVHRDLAARNCLVSKDLVVKISDFGLSRDMYSCDYYRVQSKSLLPVRWMPPESILYGKFTTESDVWSYGVVLWEIYSYGLQPYYGYNNQEVINMIRARKLLPCPEACPSYCYSLMVECWAELAVRRPSFAEISHRLRVWKTNGSISGAYFKSPEVYTNPPSKYGHSSKSSHSSESPTVCPTYDGQVDTWERNLKKASSNKLNESQSSLTSRSSSLGNKTQSTSLSNEQNTRGSRRSAERRGKRQEVSSLDRNPRNIVVSTNGDNFETKLSH